MDIVGEGDEHLVIAVVVLQRYLTLGVLALARHVYDVLVQGGLIAVYIRDELADAAGVAHGILLLEPFAPVLRGDSKAGVQKGLLAHPRVERVVVELRRVEHLGVGVEAHDGAGVVRLADNLHLLRNVAAGELHLINLPVLVDADLQPVGERVDDAGADAVEAAGDLVPAAAELAAGVQHGVHDLERGLAGLLLDIDGDAAAVIRDAYHVPRLYRDLDVVAVPGQGLVYGVVDNLVDQVVQPARACRADVHAGPHAHGLEALEHLYLARVVFLSYLLVDVRH